MSNATGLARRQASAIALALAMVLSLAATPTPASAQTAMTPDMGKLMATAGVIQVEGAGGGGLVPWATITGYGSRDSYGANVHYTYVGTQDYKLASYGVAVGIADRVELSLAKQRFTGSLAGRRTETGRHAGAEMAAPLPAVKR